MFKVNKTELRRLHKNMARKRVKIILSAKKGLLDAGGIIKDESQNICPVDAGNLRESAYLVYTGGSISTFPKFTNTRADGSKISFNEIVKMEASQTDNLYDAQKTVNKIGKGQFKVEVGHGVHYAIAVHEDLQSSRPNGERKFLSKAVDSNKRHIINNMKSNVERALR